jgi:mono/diheme cytochrome c family protein
MSRPGRLVPALALGLALAGCSEGPPPGAGPEWERGRQVYLGQCTQCHHPDPAQAGPVGPPTKGSSPEMLEAKVLRGAYPPGYTPKRPTAVMPPQPQLAPELPALAAYLR